MVHFGLLNINKPAGETSRWVVDRVQRLVKPAKAGHAGTLDPLATGVLVVCVGQATRLIDYVQRMRKRYRAEFLFGRTSATEDVEGEVVELVDPPVPARVELEAEVGKFIGEILQRPPAFSALKVGGRRAYDLARKGQPVDLEPRPVTIDWLKVVEYEYPRLVLDIECSGGTYVRSLGRDLAESLGTGAVMSALVRMAIGGFRVEESIDAETLTRETVGSRLLSPLLALGELPRIQLNATELKRTGQGQFIERPDATAMEFAAIDEVGNLVAILQRRLDGKLGAVKNFREG
ncbi:MAG: tRNA pseudouridine(55) synthase TruB [Pirellulales bacterium]|nr:tRNA pseudouridine(55) synthase TruB [Pirellulales bacterium]